MKDSIVDEQEPIFQATNTTRFRRTLKVLRRLTCSERLKWLLFAMLLVGRLVGINMYAVWIIDCFLREFRATPTCEKFILFPSPKTFRSVWLSMSIGVSFFLIFHICHRSPCFRGIKVVLCYLVRKMYFYKLLFILTCVIIYDFVVMFNEPNTAKVTSYVLFMAEKSLAVTTMLFLNFLPKFWSEGELTIKWWLYKFALGVYAFECYLLALLGSTTAVYKVLTVSEPTQRDGPPNAMAVIALMLLITNNGLRYIIADFFIHKIFHESVDNLGGAQTTEIVTIIGEVSYQSGQILVGVEESKCRSDSPS